jgi:hypothetical protein
MLECARQYAIFPTPQKPEAGTCAAAILLLKSLQHRVILL